MANNPIEMINIRHLLRLKAAGKSNRYIVDAIGKSRPTINKYVGIFKSSGKSYKALLELSDKELKTLLPVIKSSEDERYAILEEYFPYYQKELGRPGGTIYNLWEEYKTAHPQGYSYTQFRVHLNRYLKRSKGSMRFDHKYGDKMYVDYCGKPLHLTDKGNGELIPVEVFVATLPASQYIYVEASESQQLSNFIDTTANALAYFRGSPRAIVPDNLKSAVTTADNYEPSINRNFQAFGLHYGTTILPARARKPRDKALVEKTVNLVYNKIYFPIRNMTFFSLGDLNSTIHRYLERLNAAKFQELPYSRLELYKQYEQALLNPLPKNRYEIRTYRQVTVRTDFHVRFHDDRHAYSVPYQYKGKKVSIQATHARIEVYYNYERIAWHKRVRKAGGTSTKKEHLPPNIQYVKSWSVSFFLDKGNEIGVQTKAYFEQIFAHKTHPEQAYKACQGILDLYKCYPKPRIEQACRRADFYENYSYHTIKNILEKGLDKMAWQAEQATDFSPLMTESDPNIRGCQYFK